MTEEKIAEELAKVQSKAESGTLGQTETERTQGAETTANGEFGRVHIKGGINSRISEKMEKKLTPEQVKKLHLESSVGNDYSRPSMQGIYYKDGYAYASDSHILIKVRMDYPAEWEGKIINPKTGKQIEAKFPKADDVLTTYNSREDMVRVSPQEVLDALNIAAEVRKGATKTNYKISPNEVVVAFDSTNGALGGRDYKTLIISAKYAKQLEGIIKNCDNVEIYAEGPVFRIVADGVEAVVARLYNKFDDFVATNRSVIYNGKTYLGERVAEKMRNEAERLRTEAEGLFGEPKEKALREADRIEGILANAGDIKEFEAEDDLGKVENKTNFSAEERGGETSFMAEERNEEIKPIGQGENGNIYDQFRGKPKEAVDFLVKNRSGDLLGVFHRDDIGDIDLIWGNEDGGLFHIINKHVGVNENGTIRDFATIDDMVDSLTNIIENGETREENDEKKVLELNGVRVVISKDYKRKSKNWVVSAIDYNRSKEEKGITANHTVASHGAEGAEIVAPRNSENKGSENSDTSKENAENYQFSAEERGELPTSQEEREKQQEAEQSKTALQKLPKDKDGNPIFEQAESPSQGLDALVEAVGGDAERAYNLAMSEMGDATKTAQEASDRADKAAKVAEEAKTKPKGNSMNEKIAYQDKVNAEA